MFGEFEIHGRPYVFGMNGTSSGYFAPHDLPLDPATLGEPNLPIPIATQNGAPIGVSAFARLPTRLFEPDAPIAPAHAAPRAPDTLSSDHFVWTAPAPTAQSYQDWSHQVWEAPVAGALFEPAAWDAPAPMALSFDWDAHVAPLFELRPLESLAGDFFLY